MLLLDLHVCKVILAGPPHAPATKTMALSLTFQEILEVFHLFLSASQVFTEGPNKPYSLIG